MVVLGFIKSCLVIKLSLLWLLSHLSIGQKVFVYRHLKFRIVHQQLVSLFYDNILSLHLFSSHFKKIFFFLIYTHGLTSLVAQTIKCLPTVRETWVWSLGREDPLEKALATHCSTLAWKIPWNEEPGRLQSMGLQRVGHDWATSLHFFTHGLKRREIRNSNNTKVYTVKVNLILPCPGVSHLKGYTLSQYCPRSKIPCICKWSCIYHPPLFQLT